MARRFAKISEEENVAITEATFFYLSDLVNTKTTIPSGSVKSGGYIPQRFASRYNYIHHCSPPLRGIVVYYSWKNNDRRTTPRH